MKVRQAAVECISNIACTQYAYTYFTGQKWRNNSDAAGPSDKNTNAKQNLKLWSALSLDVEHVEISRAALGGLAMASSVYEDVCCSLVEMDKFSEFMNLGHYSNLELIHRALVILMNILQVDKIRNAHNQVLEKQIQFCAGYAAHFTEALNKGGYDTPNDRQMIEVTLQLVTDIVTKFM